MTKKPIKEHWTKRANWKIHSGESCPVPENTLVAYRTSYSDNNGSFVSHVHVPIAAKEINWKPTKGFGQVYMYAVVG